MKPTLAIGQANFTAKNLRFRNLAARSTVDSKSGGRSEGSRMSGLGVSLGTLRQWPWRRRLLRWPAVDVARKALYQPASFPLSVASFSPPFHVAPVNLSLHDFCHLILNHIDGAMPFDTKLEFWNLGTEVMNLCSKVMDWGDCSVCDEMTNTVALVQTSFYCIITLLFHFN